MYLLWTTIDSVKHVLLYVTNMDVLDKYLDDCDSSLIHINNKPVEHLVIDRLKPNSKLYISNIDYNGDVLYVLECSESGIKYDSVYIYFDVDKNSVLKIAVDYFTTESSKTDKKEVNKMLDALLNAGTYNIPNTHTNDCVLLFYKINKQT